MRVVVVGAGLAGLSAAAHLVGRGHDVVVVERAALPGGRAGVVTRDGFRLDTGPTVLTMPDLVAATFAAAGADVADFCRIEPVDPLYRAVFADGTELRVRRGREAMAAEIEAVCGRHDATAFHRFCDWLTALHDLEGPAFIERNYDSPADLVRPLAPAARLTRLGGFRRWGSVVRSHFEDERLRRVFTFQSMYAGLAPQQALALYAVIAYMDTVAGVYHPVGGVQAVAAGLAAAVEKAGGTVRYEAPVTAIRRAPGGRVVGVDLDGELVPADAVVCTTDLAPAYRDLLRLEPPRNVRRARYSPSCFLWVAGVRGGPPPGAAHHNLHFGAAWDDAFRALLRDGVRMPDPSILVSLPSVSDPTSAPPGASTRYVLEPVPNLDGRLDWRVERSRLRADLERRVEAMGYGGDVVVEHVLDPRDWQGQGMERGTPFALAHTFRQTGPFRPANVDRRVPGLVFAGSSTVPGVGVPMVLVSGRLAADRVDELVASGDRP